MISLTPRGNKSYVNDKEEVADAETLSVSEISTGDKATRKKTAELGFRIFKKGASSRSSEIVFSSQQKQEFLKAENSHKMENLAKSHTEVEEKKQKKIDIETKKKKPKQRRRRATHSGNYSITPLNLSGIKKETITNPAKSSDITCTSAGDLEDLKSPRKTWKRNQERHCLELDRTVLEELSQHFDHHTPIAKISGREIFKTTTFSIEQDFIKFNGKSIEFSVQKTYSMLFEGIKQGDKGNSSVALPLEAQKVFAHELIRTLESYEEGKSPTDQEISVMVKSIFDPFVIPKESEQELLKILSPIFKSDGEKKQKTVKEILEQINEKSCPLNFFKWAREEVPKIMTKKSTFSIDDQNACDPKTIVNAYYRDKHIEFLRDKIPCFHILQALSFNAFGEAAFLISQKIQFVPSDGLKMKANASCPRFEITWKRDNGHYSVIHIRPYSIIKTKTNKKKKIKTKEVASLNVCWTVIGNSYFICNKAELSISNLKFKKGVDKAGRKKIKKGLSENSIEK